MSTAAENKVVYRRFIETLFNEGRLEHLAGLVATDYVFHDAPPGTPQGAEAIRHVVTMLRSAFPDLQVTIEDQIAEGDKVCSRATIRGTHRGTIFGIPATGRAIVYSELVLVRIANGRLVEGWVRNDVAGLMDQLRRGVSSMDSARLPDSTADDLAGNQRT